MNWRSTRSLSQTLTWKCALQICVTCTCVSLCVCVCALWLMELHSLFLGLWGSADVSITDRTRLWITSLINHHQRGSLQPLARASVSHARTNVSSHNQALARTRTPINLSAHGQSSCDSYWPPTCPHANLITALLASGPVLLRAGL